MKRTTSRSLRVRTVSLVAGASIAIGAMATHSTASAADLVGSVGSFAPEAGAVLNGTLVSWQGEVLAAKAAPGGFSAFNVTTGVAAASPLAPVGVAKSPVVFNGLLAWIDSTANIVRTANAGGTVTALTGSAAGYDAMIALGSDLWMAKAGAVDKYTPNLSTSTLGVATPIGSFPATSTMRMAVGPDGNVWVVEKGAGVDTLNRFTPAGVAVGAATNFASNSADPTAIVLGPDNAMWVIQSGLNSVARFEANLSKADFALAAGAAPSAITAGTDGGVWISETASNNVARLSFAGGAFARTAYSAPSAFGLKDVISGPDGNVWAIGTVANRAAKFGTAIPTTTTIAATTTTALSTTTVPTPTTTVAPPTTTTTPTTLPAPTTTIIKGTVYRCAKTARKRVKVGKKFVFKVVCTRFVKV